MLAEESARAASDETMAVRDGELEAGEHDTPVVVAGTGDQHFRFHTRYASGFEIADAQHLPPQQVLGHAVLGDLGAGRAHAVLTEIDREHVAGVACCRIRLGGDDGTHSKLDPFEIGPLDRRRAIPVNIGRPV